MILNLTQGLGFAINYSRWQWPQEDYSLLQCLRTLGREVEITLEPEAEQHGLSAKAPQSAKTCTHWTCIGSTFRPCAWALMSNPPCLPVSPTAFHHSWPHACLFCLAFIGLVLWRSVSSSHFILLLSWLCGKMKQVVELSGILNCFLIYFWSYAWWDWHTWHKTAFTRLWPSMNKYFNVFLFKIYENEKQLSSFQCKRYYNV